MSRLEIRSPLLKHNCAYFVRRWLYENFQHVEERQAFLDNEMTLYAGDFRDFLIQRYASKSLDENFFQFLRDVTSRSIIAVVLGMRRHGKTATISSIAQEYHRQGFYVCGYNMSESLPSWFHIHKFDPEKPYFDVPNRAVIFHDECHLDIDSKNWQSPANKALRNSLSTSGHRIHSIWFTSQLASNISLDMMKYADVKLFKPMNQSNDDIDRANYLRRFSFFYPKRKDESLADLDGKLYYFRNDLPDFYNDKISRAFA